MNLHNGVSDKMEYIQKVFLRVQNYMQENHELDEIIAFLGTEPAEFRSVAYESASMEIALHELSVGNELSTWKKFYQRSEKSHPFHMDIGLGWAFAKKEISPIPYFKSLKRVMRWMVFDGIGYYHGLFHGRRTVKNQLIPDGIGSQDLHGFDQGLGRRLWYISKGNVNDLHQLIQAFHMSRYADLWRGVGIACAYVGGNDRSRLEALLTYSSGFLDQLCTGLTLAAISRNSSNSINADIELACEIICRRPLASVINNDSGIRNFFNSFSTNDFIN